MLQCLQFINNFCSSVQQLQFLVLIDANECNLGTYTCDSNANCINTVGSYTCQCRSGYDGDGHSCIGMY